METTKTKAIKCDRYCFCSECEQQVKWVDTRFIEDGLYVCAEEPSSVDNQCGTPAGIYCNTCEKMYDDMERFGLHGDIYECKACGTIHWGLTEWKRKWNEIEVLDKKTDVLLTKMKYWIEKKEIDKIDEYDIELKIIMKEKEDMEDELFPTYYYDNSSR